WLRRSANNMAGSKNKTLPSFKSVDEFVTFFESHDMGDYWDQLPRAELEVTLRKSSKASKSSSKFSSNTGKPWTPTQVKQLRQLASRAVPTRVIGLKLGRTENAIRIKASEKGVSLKPTNRSKARAQQR